MYINAHKIQVRLCQLPRYKTADTQNTFPHFFSRPLPFFYRGSHSKIDIKFATNMRNRNKYKNKKQIVKYTRIKAKLCMFNCNEHCLRI